MNERAQANPYTSGLERNAANFVPLSPLSFIARSAAVFPARLAVVHGARRYSWAEVLRALPQARERAQGARHRQDDTVAVMGANTPELFEAHFGVPMAGAVLNALNIRLDAATIAFILQHSEAKVLITDREFSGVIEPALAQLKKRPLVDRYRRCARGRRQAAGRDRLRGAPRRGRSRSAVAGAGGRMGRDRAQLHVRHDRQPEGRRLSPSRRISQRARQRARVEHAARIRSISGRCRCSIATAGASRGR